MKAKRFFLLVVLLSFSFSLFAQEAEEMITQADSLYVDMKDMATAEEARDLLLKEMQVT